MGDGTATAMDIMKDQSLEYEQMNDEQKRTFWNSWNVAVTGKEVQVEPPKSKSELIRNLGTTVDTQLEGHLAYLAEKQGKTLTPLPELTPESSADDQLRFLQTLTANINAVQNRTMAGITPHLSKELSGMDCSMSTWTMQHEAKKAGLNFAWGSPVGHAVGIVTLKDGQRYYADGQGGFVEKVDVEEVPLLHGGKILTIKNHAEIQDKHKNFFPKHVFSSDNAGVAATMTNIDSMLYKQYLGDITEDIRNQYGEDAVIVEQLQPFARAYQEQVAQLDPKAEKKVLNQMSDSLFPNVNDFRNSSQAKEEETRLHH
jgi:hypothetical protein